MVLIRNINLKFWGILSFLTITITSAAGQNIYSQTDFFEPKAKLKEVFKGGVGIVLVLPTF